MKYNDKRIAKSNNHKVSRGIPIQYIVREQSQRDINVVITSKRYTRKTVTCPKTGRSLRVTCGIEYDTRLSVMGEVTPETSRKVLHTRTTNIVVKPTKIDLRKKFADGYEDAGVGIYHVIQKHKMKKSEYKILFAAKRPNRGINSRYSKFNLKHIK
jgi:hypothetical protein